MKLPGNANSIAEIDDLEFSWEDPPTTQFADIGGYRDVKQQLKDSVIKPLRDSDNSYSRFNVEPARGLLFHGPPGTGKTLFARALANALHRPFVELTQASLTHHHINKSPQLIDQMFAEAEELHGVIFVDEAEQLVGNRNMQGNQHAEDNKITNTFLSALTQEDKSFILLLTTNMRDTIDDAILRPGRIDKQIKIDYPDASTRAKILKLKLLDVPQNVNAEYIDKIAARCEQWSGADLEALASTAKRHAAERKAESLSKEDLAYGFTEVYDGSVME
jgi:ATP-dependent 26S proteasome regulatory subunit